MYQGLIGLDGDALSSDGATDSANASVCLPGSWPIPPLSWSGHMISSFRMLLLQPHDLRGYVNSSVMLTLYGLMAQWLNCVIVGITGGRKFESHRQQLYNVF